MRDQSSQPLLVRRDELLQRGPQRLGDQLLSVQLPYRGQHMSGIDPHPAVPLDQARRHRLIDHHGQQPVCPLPDSHAVPELAEDRVIEPRIIWCSDHVGSPDSVSERLDER
ncbi:hypothetical protein ACIPSA_42590 [Streptomyces sp. NPDC086549]|uniref:hypothetical protein n=1 Tax=Streptomyces sp. NPDC086549 TaxID=3365752 RepID=UPI003825561B